MEYNFNELLKSKDDEIVALKKEIEQLKNKLECANDSFENAADAIGGFQKISGNLMAKIDQREAVIDYLMERVMLAEEDDDEVEEDFE